MNPVDQEAINNEGRLQPRAEDTLTVDGHKLTWKKYQAPEHYFDFNAFLGQQTEDSVGYAVCYIHADQEMKNLQLKTGSDDQAMVYLNGKQVLKQDQARALGMDQDTTEVTLQKGMNTLVFKVVNEKIDWSGCARFTDKDGKVIRNLKVATAPK